MKYSLGIVILARNEEEGLDEIYQHTKSLIVQRNIEHEFTIINDGSDDRTLEVAETISRNDTFVKVINHHLPLGVGFGYKEALRHTDKDYFMGLPGYDVFSDADINAALDTMGQTDITLFHITNATRPLGRRVMSHIFTILMNIITGLRHKYYNGMILCRTSSLKKINIRSNRYTYHAEAISKLQLQHNCNSTSIGFTLKERKGESSAIKIITFASVLKYFTLLIYDLFIAPSNKS